MREHVVPGKPVDGPLQHAQAGKSKAYSMTWAQRLKRVFAIDIEKCEKCGGPVRIIASIEDPDVIQKILKHLGLDQPDDPQNRSPPSDLTGQPTKLFRIQEHRIRSGDRRVRRETEFDGQLLNFRSPNICMDQPKGTAGNP